jgi:hypothetical protein
MLNVDSIFQKINENCDIKEVRTAIADLIEYHLQMYKGSLGYWEKAHFAHAIHTLAWNINSRNQPTYTMLRLCLVDIEKALVPANQRNENYTLRDEHFEALTYEELIQDINWLRQKPFPAHS